MPFESWTYSLEDFRHKPSADGLLHLVRVGPPPTEAIVSIEIEQLGEFTPDLLHYAQEVWPGIEPSRSVGNLFREYFLEMVADDPPVVRMTLDRQGLRVTSG